MQSSIVAFMVTTKKAIQQINHATFNVLYEIKRKREENISNKKKMGFIGNNIYIL